MKNILLLFVLACALGATFTAKCQTQPFQPLEFKKHKIWQNSEPLKNKEAGIIFRKQGGASALEWKKFKTSQALGWLAFIGGGILCIATLPTIGNDSDGHIIERGNQGLSLAGAGISLTGIVVLIAGNSHRKKAVTRYNSAFGNK